MSRLNVMIVYDLQTNADKCKYENKAKNHEILNVIKFKATREMR